MLKLNTILEEIMQKTYAFFHQSNTKFYDNLLIFADNFYKFFGYKHESIFVVVPNIIKCIILFAFLIDVFIFFKLKYFYFMLYFLIINLIIHIIFYVLKDFADNVENIKSELLFTTYINKKDKTYEIIIEANPNNMQDIDLNYTINEYKICNRIKGYLAEYERYHQYFNLFIIFTRLVIHSFA